MGKTKFRNILVLSIKPHLQLSVYAQDNMEQVRHLRKENAELREENEKLRKRNAEFDALGKVFQGDLLAQVLEHTKIVYPTNPTMQVGRYNEILIDSDESQSASSFRELENWFETNNNPCNQSLMLSVLNQLVMLSLNRLKPSGQRSFHDLEF